MCDSMETLPGKVRVRDREKKRKEYRERVWKEWNRNGNRWKEGEQGERKERCVTPDDNVLQ